jgi:hypothetical protein
VVKRRRCKRCLKPKNCCPCPEYIPGLIEEKDSKKSPPKRSFREMTEEDYNPLRLVPTAPAFFWPPTEPREEERIVEVVDAVESDPLEAVVEPTIIERPIVSDPVPIVIQRGLNLRPTAPPFQFMNFNPRPPNYPRPTRNA